MVEKNISPAKCWGVPEASYDYRQELIQNLFKTFLVTVVFSLIFFALIRSGFPTASNEDIFIILSISLTLVTPATYFNILDRKYKKVRELASEQRAVEKRKWLRLYFEPLLKQRFNTNNVFVHKIGSYRENLWVLVEIDGENIQLVVDQLYVRGNANYNVESIQNDANKWRIYKLERNDVKLSAYYKELLV